VENHIRHTISTAWRDRVPAKERCMAKNILLFADVHGK
jgi:hypothetical protein